MPPLFFVTTKVPRLLQGCGVTVPEKSADRATVAETAVVSSSRSQLSRLWSTRSVAFRSYRLATMRIRRETRSREERRRSKRKKETMRWMDRDRGRRDGSEITVTDLIDAIRIRGWVKNYTNSWPGWQVYQPVIPAIRFLRMGGEGGRKKG